MVIFKLLHSMKVQRKIRYILLYIGVLVAMLLYQRGLASRDIDTFDVGINHVIPNGTSLNQFQVLYERALAHLDSDNYEEAVTDFYAAYQISQKQPSLLFAFPQFLEDFHQVLLNRSLIYLHQGKEELAIQDYQLAIELLPELYSTNDRCWLMRRFRCDGEPPHRIAGANTILVPVLQ